MRFFSPVPEDIAWRSFDVLNAASTEYRFEMATLGIGSVSMLSPTGSWIEGIETRIGLYVHAEEDVEVLESFVLLLSLLDFFLPGKPSAP